MTQSPPCVALLTVILLLLRSSVGDFGKPPEIMISNNRGDTVTSLIQLETGAPDGLRSLYYRALDDDTGHPHPLLQHPK